MNCLLIFLRKNYNRIIADNTLKCKLYRITKDFRTTDPEVNEHVTQLTKILKKTIDHFFLIK